MRYALQRLGQFVIVFVVVTFAVLAATRIGSKDPALELAGGIPNQVVIDRINHDYPYLNDPVPVQYGYWLKDTLTGNWGHSYIASQSNIDMFRQRLPATIFIGLWAMVIGLVIAVPAGVYAAYRRGRWFDKVASTMSFAAISTPPVVVAVGLLFLVVTRTDLFPTAGGSRYVAPWSNPVEHFKNFFIPSLTLGLGMAGVWSRLLRADMSLTLQSDYIMLAKAKGVPPQRILWRHALRPSVLTLITSVALQTGVLISGAFVVESFFGPKGLGDRMLFAVQQKDLLVIQAITAALVVVVVVANFAVDLFYVVIDPRIRLARSLG